jgi:hypothetical protein
MHRDGLKTLCDINFHSRGLLIRYRFLARILQIRHLLLCFLRLLCPDYQVDRIESHHLDLLGNELMSNRDQILKVS